MGDFWGFVPASLIGPEPVGFGQLGGGGRVYF